MGKESVIYGRGVIREVLKSNININTLYIDKNINTESIEDILFRARENDIDIRFVYKNDVYNICKNETNQGIAAKISEYRYLKFDECLRNLESEEFPFVLILDRIQDPRNLGAILRSAECTGIRNIIIPQKRSTNITGVVWKTSMGAVAHLNICRVNNILNVLRRLKRSSFKVVATDIQTSKNVCDVQYDFPLALVIGSEHDGVSDSLLRECDIRIKIPMFGNIVSFNVSVATAIIMYEIRNIQRGKKKN